MDLVELPDWVVQRHPWEVIRFAFFFRVLRENRLLDSRHSVLDAGAGDAWFAGHSRREALFVESSAGTPDIRRSSSQATGRLKMNESHFPRTDPMVSSTFYCCWTCWSTFKKMLRHS